jgi:flagella basal body P-ring formation protein FlgA
VPSKWHRPACGTAVVPERTIYPGEELLADMVREVDVTNPNLRAGYAEITSEVLGKVTTRTLLPGRTIPVAALRDSWAVERGKTVQLIFSGNGLTITAAGTPLENAAIGDFIRVRNIESGLIVSGTVMDNGSIRVARNDPQDCQDIQHLGCHDLPRRVRSGARNGCGERLTVRRRLRVGSGAQLHPSGGRFSRIKDIASLQAGRDNQLIGYGLVVGLQGTGDGLRNSPFTEQSLRAMLQNLGISTEGGASRVDNVAAVIVTANLPPFASLGSRIDVTVSSLGTRPRCAAARW